MKADIGVEVIWLLGIFGVVASCLLRNIIPNPPPSVVGIDLGTTYSVVAVYRDGKAEMVPNEHGKFLTPSIVAFVPGRSPLVGDAARGQPNVYFDVKRLIGKRFDDPDLQAMLPMFPFTVVERDGQPFIKQGDNVLAPHEVSVHVIKSLKADAERHLNKKVVSAVLAVPAEFGEAERNQTALAAEKAGLEVLRVISEPTAAAMAYGLQNKTDDQLILVYDFGGGTLDVSLLSFESGMFTVVASSGNAALGGEDFTHALARCMLRKFLQHHSQSSDESLIDSDARQKLRNAAENAKIALSSNDVVNVEVEEILPAVNLSLTLERSQAEVCWQFLFDRLLEPVDEVLQDANSSAADVEQIVLVGGSTRLPVVQRLLQGLFPDRPQHADVDPDQAVAHGTAVQAGILTDAWPLRVAATEGQVSSHIRGRRIVTGKPQDESAIATFLQQFDKASEH